MNSSSGPLFCLFSKHKPSFLQAYSSVSRLANLAQLFTLKSGVTFTAQGCAVTTPLLRHHGNPAPEQLETSHIIAFLEYLALARDVSPSTQKAGLNAIMCLYRQMLSHEQIDLGGFQRVRPQKKLSVVLSRDPRSAEVRRQHSGE
jgi:hypothetical protein